MSLPVIVGWVGVIVYTVAYVFLSLGYLKAERNVYHILNAVGGICLVVNAYHLSDGPALVVNLVWIAIASGSIIRIAVRRV
ncbi:MAG: hypothetical protein HC859_14380 [Bacteroidia bacterium]|nr:hypothetical protein [Bacteroidia bacterium]